MPIYHFTPEIHVCNAHESNNSVKGFQPAVYMISYWLLRYNILSGIDFNDLNFGFFCLTLSVVLTKSEANPKMKPVS